MQSMSKTFNTIIAATVAVSAIAPVASAQTAFSDVKENNSHYQAILELADRGVINGYTDGTFKPGNAVTRGQAAKIIAGILKLDTTNITAQFSDVSATYEHAGAINALYKEGIISGYADGTFKPGNPITRAQMAKILTKAFKLADGNANNLPFTDVNKAGEFAPYIQALVDHNITKGTTATTYAPLTNVTRGQLATFVVGAEKVKAATGFTIERVDGDSIITSAGTFKASATVAKVVTENKDALQGAKVEGVIKNGTLETITSLTLNEAGLATAPVIFNGYGVKIAKLTINADNIKIQNTEVAGDVEITNNVRSAVTLIATNVTGVVDVAEAKTTTASLTAAVSENLIIEAVNSAIQQLNVNREAITIESDKAIVDVIVGEAVKALQLNADVQNLTLEEVQGLTISGSGKVEELAVGAAKSLNLDLTNEIAKLVVKNLAAKIELSSRTTIGTAVIPDNAQLTDVLPNASSAVKNTETASGNPATPTTPPAGGGGGAAVGGGGISYVPAGPTITSIEQPTISIGYEQPFDVTKDLPKDVIATMSDGKTQLASVNWTIPSDFKLDTTKANKVTLEGTVAGYSSKVTLTISVGATTSVTFNKALTDAKALLDIATSTNGDDILPKVEWTTTAAKETFKKAYDTATAATAKEDITYTALTAAEKAFAEAEKAFRATIKKGSQPVTSVAKAAITKLDLNNVTVAEVASAVPFGKNFIKKEQKEALEQAIAEATVVITNADTGAVTVKDYDAAMKKLSDAIITYETQLRANVGTDFDKSSLKTALETAKAKVIATSTNGENIIPNELWTTVEAKAAFEAAIQLAQAAYDLEPTTPTAVQTALTNLNTAETVYVAAQKAGVKPDVAAAQKQLDTAVAELANTLTAETKEKADEGKNYVTPEQKQQLQAAIATFQQVTNDASAGKVTVANFKVAEATFDVAYTTFTTAKKAQVGTFVDNSQLVANITAAKELVNATKTSIDGHDVPITQKWTTALAKTTFTTAINAVEALLKVPFTGAIVEKALKDLEEAKATFEATLKEGEFVVLVAEATGIAITSSPAVDVKVDGSVVGKATIAQPATGSEELHFTFDIGYDAAKLGKQFTFEYNQLTFVVKNDNGWKVTATPLATPADVKAVSNSTIQLSWKAVVGATKYEVIRTQNGVEQKIGSVTDTLFEDKTAVMGGNYEYTVRALNDAAPIVTSTYAPAIKVDNARLDVTGTKFTSPYVVISNENLDSTGVLVNGLTSKAPITQSLNGELGDTQIDGMLRIQPDVNAKDVSVNADIRKQVGISTYTVGHERTFRVQDLVKNAMVDQKATLAVSNDVVNIWVGDDNFTKEMAEQLAAEFKTNMYDLVTTNFAALNSDVDQNKKVDIVIFDIQDGFSSGNRSYLGGYFNQADIGAIKDADSNVGEILYIDTYPLMAVDTQNSYTTATELDVKKAYTTIVHEFQHLVNYAYEQEESKEQGMQHAVPSEVWLDEALSLAAEQLYLETTNSSEKYLTSRINQYNSASISPSLSVTNNNVNNFGLNSYALSYLFMEYVKVQTGKGNAILKEILAYKGPTVDSTGMTQAQYDVEMAKATRQESLQSVEAVVKKYVDPTMSLGEFITAFRIALVAQEAEGLYGFKGQMPTLAVKPYTGSSANIVGGGAVVIKVDAGKELEATTTTPIKYTGVYTK